MPPGCQSDSVSEACKLRWTLRMVFLLVVQTLFIHYFISWTFEKFRQNERLLHRISSDTIGHSQYGLLTLQVPHRSRLVVSSPKNRSEESDSAADTNTAEALDGAGVINYSVGALQRTGMPHSHPPWTPVLSRLFRDWPELQNRFGLSHAGRNSIETGLQLHFNVAPIAFNRPMRTSYQNWWEFLHRALRSSNPRVEEAALPSALLLSYNHNGSESHLSVPFIFAKPMDRSIVRSFGVIDRMHPYWSTDPPFDRAYFEQMCRNQGELYQYSVHIRTERTPIEAIQYPPITERHRYSEFRPPPPPPRMRVSQYSYCTAINVATSIDVTLKPIQPKDLNPGCLKIYDINVKYQPISILNLFPLTNSKFTSASNHHAFQVNIRVRGDPSQKVKMILDQPVSQQSRMHFILFLFDFITLSGWISWGTRLSSPESDVEEPNIELLIACIFSWILIGAEYFVLTYVWTWCPGLIGIILMIVAVVRMIQSAHLKWIPLSTLLFVILSRVAQFGNGLLIHLDPTWSLDNASSVNSATIISCLIWISTLCWFRLTVRHFKAASIRFSWRSWLTALIIILLLPNLPLWSSRLHDAIISFQPVHQFWVDHRNPVSHLRVPLYVWDGSDLPPPSAAGELNEHSSLSIWIVPGVTMLRQDIVELLVTNLLYRPNSTLPLWTPIHVVIDGQHVSNPNEWIVVQRTVAVFISPNQLKQPVGNQTTA